MRLYSKPEISFEEYIVTDCITASSIGTDSTKDFGDEITIDSLSDLLGADTIAQFVFDTFN